VRRVCQLDLDEWLFDPGGLGEGGDRPQDPLDERLVRQLGNRRPELGHVGTLARLVLPDFDEPVDDLVQRTSASSTVQPGSSVSTVWKPRRASSTSALDLPVPDMPVTRIRRTAAG
jgi:hypothetical protein